MTRWSRVVVPALLVLAGAAVAVLPGTGPADPAAADPFAARTFLTDYTKLKPTPSGPDYMYVAPEAEPKFAQYTAVMVDQPEVALSAASPYKSAKPHDLAVIAEFMRGAVSKRLASNGLRIVDQKGPGVMYLRMALSDLQLQKKKRGVLTYTPIGAVAHAAARALKDITGETDILEMTVEAEALDSEDNLVLGATMLHRGGAAAPKPGAGEKAQKPERIKFEQFEAEAEEYADRMACRIENARRAPEQRVDCMDPGARAKRVAPPAPRS